jgi:uncharacterized protein
MRNKGNPTIVALFVRVPVPGRVKTRLVSVLGEDGACGLYRAMVADILANVSDSGIPIYLFHDGICSSELPDEWVQVSSKAIAQTGCSIGEKMAAAFEYCFAENIEQVVLAGSDIPGLNSDIIVSAVVSLETHDVAIAPAADGGYCLIALRHEKYKTHIFQEVPWSTDQVLRATLDRCEKYKLSVGLLATLQDIDTIEDIKAYRLSPSKCAVSTNTYLREIEHPKLFQSS